MEQLFIPAIGLVYFGGALSEGDLDQLIADLCLVPMPERAEHFETFELQDADTGVIVRGQYCIHAPLGAVGLSRLLAAAVRVFPSDVALRAKWMRQSGTLLAFQGAACRCGYCLSCDSELPQGDLFGYCPACRRAAVDAVFTEDSVTLRGGVN